MCLTSCHGESLETYSRGYGYLNLDQKQGPCRSPASTIDCGAHSSSHVGSLSAGQRPAYILLPKSPSILSSCIFHTDSVTFPHKIAMAAAVAPALDLTTNANFPIRLGNSILKPTESKKFTTVRYNHKPRLVAGKDVKGVLSYRAQDSNTIGLSLKDGETQYKYVGKDASSAEDDRYVLLPRGSGKNKELVLEKLSACADVNLLSSSDAAGTRSLKGEHPRLPKDDSSDEQPPDAADDLFGEPADPRNPFDYRNYLGKGTAKPNPSKADNPRPASSTPQASARKSTPPPQSKPAKQTSNPLVPQKKRKAADTSKPNPKRVKAGEEPPPKAPAAAPTSTSTPNIPNVRLDRKASLKLPPFEDSGELVLEDETPVQEKPRSAMHLALHGQLGQGPISLHSAANSPAGRRASPGPTRPEHVDEEGEIEFDLGSPEAPPQQRGHDEDIDSNVDDSELPPPTQTHQHDADAVAAVDSRASAVDEEDDLGNQLALAMAEDDDGDGGVVATLQHESDEESEEE